MLCVTFLTAQNVPSYVPTNGLVGWWPFNGNANDESGNGNNGTVKGAILTDDRNGVSNSAYYFSSSGCATRIDVSVNTTSITSGLTIQVWAMRSGNGCYGPRLLEFWANNGAGNAQWGWDNSNTGIRIGSHTSSGSIYKSLPTRLNNVWTQLVYTNNGTMAHFYQDGVLLDSLASSGVVSLSGNAAFGRMNHSAWDAFNGNLDDIGVWNRALTPQEIHNLYTTSDCQDTVQFQPTSATFQTIPGTAHFTAAHSDTSATYQWQQNSGTGWTDLYDFGIYSGTSTDSLILTGVTASLNGYGYRCIIDACTMDTTDVAYLTVVDNVGIEESSKDLTVSPNPTSGLMSINLSGTTKYNVFNMTGQRVADGKTEGQIDLTNLPSGSYQLILYTEEGNKTISIQKL